MKTSNKLLLGLFAFIIVSMVTGNIVLKNEIKKRTNIENQIDNEYQTDSVSTNSESIHIDIR
jgi:hypothetical protein